MKATKKGMAMGGTTSTPTKASAVTNAIFGADFNKPKGGIGPKGMGPKKPRGMGLGPNDKPMGIKGPVKGPVKDYANPAPRPMGTKPTIEPKPKAGYMAKGGMVKKGMAKGGMAKGGKY